MQQQTITINNKGMTLYLHDSVWFDGDHETTQTILQILGEMDLAGKKLLDIGTGSGVLAIYAAMCGADVAAVDINGNATELTRKNAEENNVDVDVFVNDLTQGISDKYDVIVANLDAHAQIENLKTAFDFLTDDGVVIATWDKCFSFARYVKNVHVVAKYENREYDIFKLTR